MVNFRSFKLTFFLMAVVGLSACQLEVAYAQSGPGPAFAACFFVGLDCTGVLDSKVLSISASESARGRERLDCSGTIPKSVAPQRTVICRGPEDGVCTLQGISDGAGAVGAHSIVQTTDWTEVITRSGQVTLHCRNLQPQSTSR